MNDKRRSRTGASWASRLSPAVRVVAIALAVLILTLLVRAITGFVASMIDEGTVTRPIAWAALAAFLSAFAILAVILVQLVRSWRESALSAYDKRYYRMWAVMGLLGLPVGFGLAFVTPDGPGTFDGLIGDGPLSIQVALLTSTLLLLVLALSGFLYHRAIDDHEERAYLWSSTLAFYVLSAGLPVVWLLGRGGLMEPLGAETAFAVLFASLAVQTVTWLWLKYR